MIGNLRRGRPDLRVQKAVSVRVRSSVVLRVFVFGLAPDGNFLVGLGRHGLGVQHLDPL